MSLLWVVGVVWHRTYPVRAARRCSAPARRRSSAGGGGLRGGPVMLWRDVGGDQGPGDPPEQFAQFRNAVRLPIRGQAVDSRFAGDVQPGGDLLAGRREREAGSRPGAVPVGRGGAGGGTGAVPVGRGGTGGGTGAVPVGQGGAGGGGDVGGAGGEGEVAGGQEFGQALIQFGDGDAQRPARACAGIGALSATRYISQVPRGLSGTPAASARRR